MESRLTLSPDRECNETDVRLAGGGTSALYEYGRVEICLDGFWGRILLYRWDYKDAKVVCRQLGYDGCEFFFLLHRLSSISFPYLLAYTVSNYNFYGTRFYHLGYVGCTGNKTALINCGHTEVGVENVYYGQRDAGVKCSCMFTFSSFKHRNVFSQTGNVMRLLFDSLVVKHQMMDEWRYVWMGPGVQSVVTDGTTEMLILCVDNWDMMDVSLNIALTSVRFNIDISSVISSTDIQWI